MSLCYDVLVTLPPRAVRPDGVTISSIPSWSPISSTLLLGDHSAILVDCPPTIERAAEVAGWIESTGRELVAMYATHGHGDHFLGFTVIARSFPNARMLGTPGTVALAREQASGPVLDGRWRALFPGQIPDDIRPLEPVDAPALDLDGHTVRLVQAGHSDTRDTTYVHVPELDLVVAGDIVYNDVHIHTSETDRRQRAEWRATIDAIAALEPVAVIAGHKRPGNADGPRILAETRQYLRDTDDVLALSRTPDEFVDLMLQRHLGRVNPNVLWDSARRLVAARIAA